VPSLIAAIGEVIEGHMVRIGFLTDAQASGRTANEEQRVASSGSDPSAEAEPVAAVPEAMAGGRPCPRCGVRALHRREGCWVCDSCGYSKCG
jgi:ribonucleoside-diphosphate reductase alpha chain